MTALGGPALSSMDCMQALSPRPKGGGVSTITAGGRFAEVREQEWAVIGEPVIPQNDETPQSRGAALHMHTKPSIAATSYGALVSHPDGSLHDCSELRDPMTCAFSTPMYLHSLTVQPHTSALWAVDDEGKVRQPAFTAAP